MFCKFCGKTLYDAIPFCSNCRQKHKKQTAKKDLEHLNYISVLLTGKPVVVTETKQIPPAYTHAADSAKKTEEKPGFFSKLFSKK